MPNLGCTIIQKDRGLGCDVEITWDFGKKSGTWKRLKQSARPISRNVKALNFGETGDVIQSIDRTNGNETFALSLYDTGAAANVAAGRSTGSQAHVHIVCGDAKSVFERVTCGSFLSGKAILWRTRENAEYEFWFSCS